MRHSTNIVNLSEPFYFTILTLEETQINLSKSNGGEYLELLNSTVPKGEVLIFDFDSVINFEFLDNAHVRVKLNEIPLDRFLSNDGMAIRGSYESYLSQLYLGFYKK